MTRPSATSRRKSAGVIERMRSSSSRVNLTCLRYPLAGISVSYPLIGLRTGRPRLLSYQAWRPPAHTRISFPIAAELCFIASSPISSCTTRIHGISYACQRIISEWTKIASNRFPQFIGLSAKITRADTLEKKLCPFRENRGLKALSKTLHGVKSRKSTVRIRSGKREDRGVRREFRGGSAPTASASKMPHTARSRQEANSHPSRASKADTASLRGV